VADDQRRIRDLAETDADIDLLIGQRGRPRRQVEVEGDLRVASREFIDQGCNEGEAEFDRHRQAQAPGRPFGRVHQRFVRQAGFLHDELAALEVAPPRLGHGETPSCALEQAHADPLFQRCDATRQGGDGHAGGLCSAGEAPGARHLHEKSHVLQRQDRRRTRRQVSPPIFSPME
jgi:hypothetical protein